MNLSNNSNAYSEEHRQVQWLSPGDPAHQVLVEHLHSKNFLSQLEQAVHGQHTGSLEVLHSLLLTYASKRVDYDPPSYEGRMQLAILDHNENCQRKAVEGTYVCYVTSINNSKTVSNKEHM